MKKVYNVSYDLRKTGKDYTGLHAELKRTEYNHLLGSTWLLYTAETSIQIWDRLATHIDADDRILIISVVNNKAGWLNTSDWAWLNERLNGITA